jgi:hypothetical protein
MSVGGKVADNLAEGASKVLKGSGGHYAKPTGAVGDEASALATSTDWARANNFKANGMAKVDKDGKEIKHSFWGQVGTNLGMARGNWEEAAAKEGSSVLGMTAKHAGQGAVFGGLAGGTIEAAQGGSFWDGAKQGAFNGAIGVAGARGLKRATGADSYLFGKNSIAGNASRMWRGTGKDSEISGQARAILTNRQMEGVARNFMHQRKANS